MSDIWFWMAKEIAELLVIAFYILVAWLLLFVVSKVSKIYSKDKNNVDG